MTRTIVEYEYDVVPAATPADNWLSLPYERMAM